MTRPGLKARLVTAGALALVLAACDDRGGRIDAPEPAPLADLSAVDELPYAEPSLVEYREPAQGYAWAERAYGLQRAVYDTPPDYGFDYGGVEPLVWETEDDWVMYAEPWDDGYRYYYYEPGAAYPYFIRDDDYGYGYGVGGVLVAVFDSGGRYLPVDVVYRVAPTAGRYYARGYSLRSAGQRARRIQVTDQVWTQRAPDVIRTADPWLRAARDDRRWRAWRERDQDRELRRFEPEAARRAARSHAWRERDDHREAAVIRTDDHRGRREVEDRRRQIDRQPAETNRRGARENQRQAEQAAHQEQRRQVEEQRRQVERVQAQRQANAQADRQRQEAQGRRAEQQQRQAERQAQRQQAEHQRRAVDEQHRQHAEQQRRQGEQRVRQEAARQQVEQHRQAARQHRQQAAQQQQQAQQQRQQAQQQQRQQAQQQREQPRHQQAQARSAEQQAQPAAGRERGGGQGHGKGKDRKD